MIVAFWNINTGVGSFFTRIQTLQDWVAQMRPALLLFEEASSTLDDATLAEWLPGYQPLLRVNTLDKNDDPSTKCLIALQYGAQGLSGHELRLPTHEATRMSLKVTAPHRTAIWGLHANASDWGGILARDAALAYVRSDGLSVVGGDFNHQIPVGPAIGADVSVHPLAHDGTPLRFSQWGMVAGSLPHDATTGRPDLHLDAVGCGRFRFKYPDPHGMIDYVMRGQATQVTRLPNCRDQAMWMRILLDFDHCPVVYDIQP